MKKCRKLSAFVLAFAMLFLNFVSANAVTLSQDTALNIPTEIEGKRVLSEATDMRDEYGKTYLMEDGTYTYINYGTPVHYEKDGEWKEFDLSLSSNLLMGRIENDCEATQVSFASNSPSVSLSSNDKTLSWNVTESNVPETSVFSLLSGNTQPILSATVETATVTDISDNHSKLNYTAANADYSIEYKVYPYRVKENIIINSAEAAEFDVTLNTDGMTAQITGPRTATIYDADGGEAFEVSVPYMYDASGAESSDIDVTLQSSGNGYVMNIKPDEAWLNASERVYPVTIDPEYYIPYAGTVDTYVQKGDSAGEFCAEPRMYVGTLDSKQCYSYVYIPSSSAASQRINSATLRLHLSSSTQSDSGPFTLYRATSSWDEDTISYANQPSTSAIDSDVDFETDENGGKYVDFDITQWAKKVKIGSYSNYGFKIADVGSSGNGSYFRTVDYSDTSRIPRIIINYTLYIIGDSSNHAGTFPLNNISTYKFLKSSSSSSLTTAAYSTSSSTNNEQILWDIYNISYTGHSVIRSNKYPDYALYADNSGVHLGALEGYSESGTPYSYQWNIFEYSSGVYCIKNRATGKVLSVSGTTSITATPSGSSSQRWRIGYTYCTSMSAKPIAIAKGEYVSYTGLASYLTLNGGNSTPTNATSLSVYSISASPSGKISLDSTGITAGNTAGTVSLTVSRKDTTATCTMTIRIAEFDGTYFIKNAGSGYYMEDNSETYIKQYSFNSDENQKWKLEMQNDGYYTIENVETETFLEVYNESSSANIPLITTAYDEDSDGQRFRITQASSGNYTIEPKCSESNDYVLGAASTSSGAYLGQGAQTSSNYLDEWNFQRYKIQIAPYYDRAFAVRYGDASSLITNLLEDVQEVYLKTLDLDVEILQPTSINSTPDNCKTTRGLSINSSTIDLMCPANPSNSSSACNYYETNKMGDDDCEDCTSWQQIYKDFIDMYPGNSTKASILFTGNTLYNELGETANRSFAWYNEGIVIQEIKQTATQYRTYMLGCIVHEIAHKIGAIDHYHEVKENGTCPNSEFCNECKPESGRPYWCVMDDAWQDDLLESDNDEVFCNDCTNEMIEHISNHHLYSC